MKDMNVYDFDGTLYEGDSTADFLRFCALRHPRIISTLPATALAALACLGFRYITKTQFKEMLYRFLPKVPNIKREVQEFWKQNEHKIKGPCNPKAGDLVISAGPDFLLHPVCEKHDWELIATKVDPITGHMLTPNCSDEEKVVRFREAYPEAKISHFYSDSHNDDPMAAIAKEAFMVRDGKLYPWSPRA